MNSQPFPSPRDPPNPGTKLRSPALQADSLLSEPPGKPWVRGCPKVQELNEVGFECNAVENKSKCKLINDECNINSKILNKDKINITPLFFLSQALTWLIMALPINTCQHLFILGSELSLKPCKTNQLTNHKNSLIKK